MPISKPNILNDCTPEAEKVHIDLLRKGGIAKRFALMASLTDSMRSLSRRAISRANPNLTDFEKKIKFVSLCYGEELGNKFRDYLLKNNIAF